MDESQHRSAMINVVKANIANHLQKRQYMEAAAYVVFKMTDKASYTKVRHDALHDILTKAIDNGDIVDAQDIRKKYGSEMHFKDKWMVDDLIKVEEQGTPPPETIRGGIHALLASRALRKT